MTYPISDVTRRVVYSGSAGVGPYSFSFEILANTDIAVYKNSTLLTLTTNYTVTINGDGTGSVTLTAPATASDQITLVGDRAIQRSTDFVTGGDLFANTLNEELDSLTIFAQQVDEKANRGIKAPVTDPTTIDMTLAGATARANTFMYFDSNGEPAYAPFGSPGSPSVVTRQRFSGDDVTTAFTLATDPGASGASLMVYIGGVYQNINTYSVTGTTLTFSEAPVAGTDNIEVVAFTVTNIGETDAGQVSYTPAGTGAVATNVQSKLREFVSVADFATVDAALAYCSENNVGLLLPVGVTTATGAVTLNKGVTIKGVGRDVSELRFPGANGLVLNITDETEICGFSDFKITTTDSTGAGVGVHINRNIPATVIRQPQDTFDNVDFGGSVLDVGYFGTALKFTNSRSPRVHKCSFWGRFSSPNIATAAIDLRGQTINAKIVDCQGAGFTYFIYGTDTLEGVQVFLSQCSLCFEGVRLEPTLAGRPQMMVLDSHFNTLSSGIYLKNVAQSFVRGNLLYSASQGGGFVSSGYTGITIEAASGETVVDVYVNENTVVGLNTVSETGLSLTGAGTVARVNAINNSVTGMDVGVQIDAAGQSFNVFIWNYLAATTPWVGGIANANVRIERSPSTNDVGVFNNATEVFNIDSATGRTSINGKRVVGERVTGWALPTGTNVPVRTTYTSYVKPASASATYSQSEMDAVMVAIQAVSARLATLIRDLHIDASPGGHGILGAS